MDYFIGGKGQCLKLNSGTITESQQEAAAAWDACYQRFYTYKASRCESAAMQQVEWNLLPTIRDMVEQSIRPQDFQAVHLETRIGKRKQAGISDTTLRQECMLLTAMFRIAVKNKLVKKSPLVGYEMPPRVKPYIRTASPTELQHLLKVVRDMHKPSLNPNAKHMGKDKNALLSLRDTAIIILGARTAMPSGEILRLILADYQPDQGRVAIRIAKDREPRFAPIYADGIAVVNAYLKVRPKDALCESLFISDRGLPMVVNSWAKEFKKYASAAGLSEITPRSLRHYGLTQMAQTNLLAATAAAGHSSLATTRGYLHNDFAHTRSTGAGGAGRCDWH